MPESLSSFLVSVSIILAVVLFVPCIESIVRLVRHKPRGFNSDVQGEAAKVYSREVA